MGFMPETDYKSYVKPSEGGEQELATTPKKEEETNNEEKSE
jgi:hypothetical protein